MRLTVKQEALAKAISLVGRSVSSRSTLPVLGNILLTAVGDELKLGATNLEISTAVWIDATVDDMGSITVPARLLTDFVGNLPPEDVTLELTRRTMSLYIRCGKYEANIKGIDAADFPIIPSYNEQAEGVQAYLDPQTLKKMVEFTSVSASTDESRANLCSVEVWFKSGKLSMAATDGYRLSYTRQDAKANGFEVKNGEVIEKAETDAKVLIPAKSMGEIARIAKESDQALTIGMRVTQFRNQAIFYFTGKADSKEPTFKRLELATQLVDANYPDYTAIVPKKFNLAATVDTAGLQKAIRLAFLFARDNANIVRFRLSPSEDGSGNGTVTLTATSAEMGDNVSDVPALIESSGPKMEQIEMAFNAKYLLDVLNTVTEPQIRLETTETTRPGLFSIPGIPKEDHMYVCMPMHPPR